MINQVQADPTPSPATAPIATPPAAAAPIILPAPPQDQGLPYTRTAHKFARAKIKDCIAVYAGSRYAYVDGYKVRLDQKQLRSGEAAFKDGVVLVPPAFIPVLDLKEINPPKAPDYLADRWVYDLGIDTGIQTVQEVTASVSDLAAEAKKRGFQIFQDGKLLILSKQPFSFADNEKPLEQSVITLFDTPEKLADPDIATKYIPTLTRQGKWTDHVKVTPEQQAILDGPETKWQTAPKSDYDFNGFNEKLLGSKVPAPGVYPRLLFSEADLPMLAERIKKNKVGQRSLIEMECIFKRTWWDSTTPDGQLFEKLAKGDTSDLKFTNVPGQPDYMATATFVGYKPGVYNSHIQYVPECLTSMALYCLLMGDEEHGKMAANAFVNYYKLREPLLDEANSISDSEFGSSLTLKDGTVFPMNGNGCETHWRAVAGVVAHMDLGLGLDFTGKWLTDDQKATMYRIIGKATYGKRSYAQDAPVRFRDVNWMGWDLTDFLAVASIEGQEGFDQEAFDSGVDSVRAFCDWGIDDNGVVYESNGKTPGSFEFITLSMITAARRGENYFGHPHFRKLLTGQIQMTSPSGLITVNSGTQYAPFSHSPLSFQLTDNLKGFFPDDRRCDYLLDRADLFGGKKDEGMRMWSDYDTFDQEKFKNEEVSKLQRLRLPSPTYPGFVHAVLYDTDYAPTTRADLNLPLDFVAPTHGVYSGYSDRTTKAAWMNMMVRPDHYLGAGHHHADAGMFFFSSGGVDWFSESPLSGAYPGKYYNLVQVDGHSECDLSASATATCYNAPGKFLGATTGDGGSVAGADLTYAYTYRWQTQPAQVWDKAVDAMGWELDPSPEVLRIFAGTSHYKLREWWASYTYSNYIATSRAKFNPMEYVFRSVGLVRGPHPYGFVVDDAKKDDTAHDYSWVGMVTGGVWKATVPGVPANALVLGHDDSEPAGPTIADLATPKAPLTPKPGDPLLLVQAINLDATPDLVTLEGPLNRSGKPDCYDRVTIPAKGVDAQFRVLLIPFNMGEPIPKVTYDAASGKGTIEWADQKDELTFTLNDQKRTLVKVERDGKSVVEAAQ